MGQIGSLNHHYLFEHPKVHKRSIQKSHLHYNLTNHPHIKWCQQQKELKRTKRNNYLLFKTAEDISDIIPDPLFEKQWFLNHGAVDGSDMNVIPAWQKGFTGKVFFTDCCKNNCSKIFHL